MEISVIIPTYRPDYYFVDCLRSLQAQTIDHSVFEILIILNGPKESYEFFIQDLVKKYLNDIVVKVFYTDKASVSNARNIGIDNAAGKFLTFIDDDDYVSPTYLLEMYEIACENIVPLTNILAFNDLDNSIVEYGISTQYKLKCKDVHLSQYKVRAYFSVPVCKLIRKDIIGERRFNCCFKNSEDALFMLAISDKINDMAFTSSKAIYYRRIRNNSATTKKRSLFYLLGEDCKILIEVSKIWWGHPFEYNLWLFLTRPLALLKAMYYSFLNKY